MAGAPKLGIIAGGGAYPAQIIAACQQQDRPFHVLAIEGQADHPAIDAAPHTWLRLGAAGEAEKVLRAEGCQEVILAGHVRRPSLREIRPDARAAGVLLKATMKSWGDDSLLGAIIKEFEKSGFRVVGVDTILSELLAPAGPVGRHRPDADARRDIDRGVAVAQGLGALDVGQAVVVQQGIVLGVEAIEGTDALIRRCGELRRDGPGGVLVKLVKPGQDRRVDLPTIGVETVRVADAAGLQGIAVQAGGTQILDRPAVVEAADAAGLFVVGIEVG
jgi:DUF1009 family protein